MSMSQLMVHFDNKWFKMDMDRMDLLIQEVLTLDLQGQYTLLKRTLTKAPTVFDQQDCISFRRISILPQDLIMTTGMIQVTWIIQSIIESDNVVLDLNGHTIQMSKEFYLLQRFCNIIEVFTSFTSSFVSL
jgi:hypothetical protein